VGLRQRVVGGLGRVARERYARRLPELVRRPVEPPTALDVDVVAFSGRAHLPEQVASLRSFLSGVGRPRSYTVVSDGTHRPADATLLAAVDPSVRVLPWTDVASGPLPDPVPAMAATSAMGIKLAVELSLPVQRVTAYVDSDVLFGPAAGELVRLLDAPPAPALHLVDPEDVYLDARLLRAGESDPPVNAGFFVLTDRLVWTDALVRLSTLDGAATFHTEQTVVHLAMRASGALPLDPQRYVVATDDMRGLRDLHRGPDVVLRHYTTPVRPKMWLAVGAGDGSGAPPSRG
jgi:hypothetical protein